MTKSLSKKEMDELTKLRKEQDLPHLYGWKWYPWAWEFFSSMNRFNFLCAANQISKSSTQIRKAIDWATDKSKWGVLWPGRIPTQFLYMYPSKPVATTEFNEKWETELLPRNKMKKDPVYGWQVEYKNKEIWAVHFNSGVSIYFKTYAQDVQDLQASTVYAVFTDEELPTELFNELRTRLTATNGYFHMVFTATLGQDMWRRTIEPRNEDEELFKGALKLQVSMYDCLKYKDGSQSFWTMERIKEIETQCTTEAEVQKRIHGRFVLSGSGLAYQSFSILNNMTPKRVVPEVWPIYTGVDVGSGGGNHPAAITMIAVRPDYKYGIVFKGWRGDGVVTTSGDVLAKHTELLTYYIPSSNGELIKRQLMPTLQNYDWHNKDFQTISSRAGQAFTPANKSREAGSNLLNTLFKFKMLAIMEGDPELQKLALEFSSLQTTTHKTKAQDDFIDSCRYAAMAIPWDFDGVAGEIIKVEENNVDTRTEAQKVFDERVIGRIPDEREDGEIEAELAEWQDRIDGF